MRTLVVPPGRNWKRRSTLAAAIASLTLLLPTGCGPGAPLGSPLAHQIDRSHPRVLLFICDGLGQDIIDQGCREGWLPNIKARLIDPGTHVQNNATAMPAITYGAIASLLTGLDPGRHSIVGNRWFDPDLYLFRDYTSWDNYRDINLDCNAPTLYELIQPAESISIQCAHTRGVTYNIHNWGTSGVMWCFGDYTAVDKLSATSIDAVAAWANWHGRLPSVLTCYFPGADSVGHRHGATSADYRNAVQHVDWQVGRVCNWLEKEHLLDTTYLVLVSDHGLVDASDADPIDLPAFVAQWGLRSTCEVHQDRIPWYRRSFYPKFDVVVAHQNGRAAFLYFHSGQSWETPTTPADVVHLVENRPPDQQLWHIPGVQLVAYLSADDEATLRCGDDLAHVRRRLRPDGIAEYTYIPESGDVLGYLADPDRAAFVHAGFHDSRAWLTATAAAEIPDVVPHIVDLLHVHRAGQVVLFTRPGYSFTHERGGHGGVNHAEMRSAMLVAGPGVRAGGIIPAARSTDLVPTIMDLLGIPFDAARFDGRSLKPELSQSEAPKAEP